ncbi:MAG: cell division protein ZapA [Alphaproteobacteria bacterium]|nr:cell division protein ZapA [Alphaproteobacteria bacterium]
MAEITISVNSRPFQIICRDGDEEQVMQLAEDFAARVATTKKGNEKAGDSHLMVLTGLMLCNDIRDLKHELDAVRQEMLAAGKSRDALSARVDEIEEVLSLALNSAAEKIEAILPDMTNSANSASEPPSSPV